MSDNKRTEQDINKDLLDEIKALKAEDPAPRLSGAAKASILAALPATEAESSSNSLAALIRRISGSDFLLKPVSLGTFGVAGIAGLFAGSLMTAPAVYAELTPEEELASYYEIAIGSSDLYTDPLVDGSLDDA